MKKSIFLFNSHSISYIEVFAQTKSSTGTITDAIDKIVIGISVVEFGTTNDTIIDFDETKSVFLCQQAFQFFGIQTEIELSAIGYGD